MYDVERLPIVLPLGRQGENLARELRFDLSGWLAQHPAGRAEIVAERPGEGVPYVAGTRLEGVALVWEITAGDTAAAGEGRMEIRLTEENVVCKSAVTCTAIAHSIDGEAGELPEAAPDWVQQVQDAAEAARGIAKTVEDKLAAGEFVGPQGVQGTPGFSPNIDVTSTSTGHRVTITDATNVDVFDVENGKIDTMTLQDLEEIMA